LDLGFVKEVVKEIRVLWGDQRLLSYHAKRRLKISLIGLNINKGNTLYLYTIPSLTIAGLKKENLANIQLYIYFNKYIKATSSRTNK